jgi:hypothetical protein
MTARHSQRNPGYIHRIILAKKVHHGLNPKQSQKSLQHGLEKEMTYHSCTAIQLDIVHGSTQQ